MNKITLMLLSLLFVLPIFAQFEEPGITEEPIPSLTIHLTPAQSLSEVLTEQGLHRIGEWGNEYFAPILEVILTGSVQATDFPTINLIENLQTLNLKGATVESNEIPAEAFGFDNPDFMPMGNTTLQTVLLPSNITKIGNEAFIACANLTTINLAEVTQLRDIGNKAFNSCYALESIYIPASVNYIGERAFSNCSSLKTIVIAPGNSKYEVYEGGLYDMTARELQFYPDGRELDTYTVKAGTIAIAPNLFNNRWDLQGIILPTSLRTIGSDAFRNCGALQNVTFPEGLETIENTAFAGSGIQNAILPSTLRTLSIGAFSMCQELRTVVLPASLETLGGSAFLFCSLLEQVDFSKATKLTYLPMGIFNGCGSLTSVDLSKNTNLTEIEQSVFENCTALASVELPASLRKIGFGAFQNCAVLSAIDFKNVTDIDASAFHSCVSLQAIHIPSAMKTIGESAFANCNAIASVTVDNGNWDFEVLSGILYNDTMSGKVIIFSPSNNPTVNLVLPNGVNTIPDYAFTDNHNLKTIRFEGNIQSIGNHAFEGCVNLESVIFSSTAQLSRIGDNAFANCFNLGTIDLSVATALSELGYYAFQNCTTITALDLSKTNISAYYGTFEGCENLSSLKLNNNYYGFGMNALSGCLLITEFTILAHVDEWSIDGSAFSNSGIDRFIVEEGSTSFATIDGMLTNFSRDRLLLLPPAKAGVVELPNGIVTIAYNAISNNPKITKLIGNEGLEYLDYSAIAYMDGLTHITLPASFKGFSDMAIMDCYNLSEITILSLEVPAVEYYSFGWSDQFPTFFVPEAVLDLYLVNENWNQYTVLPIGATSTPELEQAQIIVFVAQGVLVVETPWSTATVELFDIAGQKLAHHVVDNHRAEINIGARANTILIVRITSPEGVQVTKKVKA